MHSLKQEQARQPLRAADATADCRQQARQ